MNYELLQTEIMPDKEIDHLIGNLEYLNDEVNAHAKYAWTVIDECQVEVLSDSQELTTDLFMLCHILALQITPTSNRRYIIEH